MSASAVRLEFDGIENFRDFGGYACAGGHVVRGRLFRSAGMSRASDADLERLAALGLTVILDLRRPDEQRRDPARRPADFAGALILGEAEAIDDWRAHIGRGDISAGAFRAFLRSYYAKAPFEPRHLGLFSRWFQALAETPGAALVHCSAGKDRTGILVALTQHLLGVARDDIFADYLLTNDRARLLARAPMIADLISETAGRRPDEAATLAAMGVEAEYLAGALAAIEERCGGLDAYLADSLGVDAATRAAIVGRLVA